MSENVSHLDDSTRQYCRSESVAGQYDAYFADTALFEFDACILSGWLVHLAGARGARLLDLGCGTGRLLIPMAQAGFDVTGIDLSGHMLDISRSKLQDKGLDARLIRGDLIELDRHVEPGSFDAAICMFSTLGMVRGASNRIRLLRQIRSALVEGGLFALHVHNRQYNGTIDGPLRALAGMWRCLCRKQEWGDKFLAEYRGVRRMYLHLFSLNEIETALSRTGFSVRDVVFLNRDRNAMLGGALKKWRANGYLILAKANGETETVKQ